MCHCAACSAHQFHHVRLLCYCPSEWAEFVTADGRVSGPGRVGECGSGRFLHWVKSKVQHWALRPNYDIYCSGLCCSHLGLQHVTAISTAFSSALYNTACLSIKPISGAENNQIVLKTKYLCKVSMTQLNLDRKLEDSQHAGDCSAWPKAAAGPV